MEEREREKARKKESVFLREKEEGRDRQRERGEERWRWCDTLIDIEKKRLNMINTEREERKKVNIANQRDW